MVFGRMKSPNARANLRLILDWLTLTCRPINGYVWGYKHPDQGLLGEDARYGVHYDAHEDFIAAEQFTNYEQAHDVKLATDRTNGRLVLIMRLCELASWKVASYFVHL
ncbi:hypothetical protein D3C73_407230 [compost metagenome]